MALQFWQRCLGIVNRGLAVYNGMIIAPINDGRLQALDAITGKPVWESRVAYPQDLYTLTMAPRFAGGKVIIGASLWLVGRPSPQLSVAKGTAIT